VANDYAKHLHIGAVDCHGVIADSLGHFLVSKSTADLPEIERCEYLNISICPATETNNVSDLAICHTSELRKIALALFILYSSKSSVCCYKYLHSII